MAKPRKPSKKTLDGAVLSMRHLLSLASDIRGRLSDETRMRARVTRRCAGIAKTTGLGPDEVWRQVEAHARKLGPLVPLLGKDL
jgi:hypothetical protein